MKTFLFRNNSGEIKIILLALFVLISISALDRTLAYAQGMGMKNHPSPDSEKTMTDQISEIRSKLFGLETALEMKHQGKTGRIASGTDKTGMNKMGPMGQMQPNGMNGGPMRSRPKMANPPGGMSPGPKMNGTGMMGMKMMGRMNKKSSALLPSSLPGFPGVSHIYHIGSTDFFLDHSDHIRLTVQQKTKLNQIKEQTTLDYSTKDRNAKKLEQDLWVLTSSDQPDIKKIDEKIGEITRLKGKMRLAFIQAVGEAARVLTSEQLEQLKGM